MGTPRAPFIPWGTPLLGAYPAFRPGSPTGVPGGNTAAEQAQQVGMHHDGMHYFPLHAGRSGSERGLLVINHEYTDEIYLHTGTVRRPATRRRTPPRWCASRRTPTGVSVVGDRAVAGRGEWTLVRSRAQPPHHRQHADGVLRPGGRAPARCAPPPTRRAAAAGHAQQLLVR